MKYSKKDRTKVIVLGALLVAVWVFIAIYYVGLSRRFEAQYGPRHDHGPAAQAPTTTQPSQATPPLSRVAALVSPLAPPERDPFRPIISPRTRGAATRPSPSQQQADRPPPPLPPLTAPSASSSARSRDRLHVTGIISGDTPAAVAVLRIGDEHYVVRPGQRLDNDIRVQAIAASTVTLRDDSGTYILRLGE